MSGDPYSAEVRALFAEPLHAGQAGGASERITSQGVDVELSADVRDDRLLTLRFRAKGCPHLIAAAEALCADLEGRPAAALGEPFGADIMRRLSVPVEKTGRILVLEDVAAALSRRLAASPGA